MKLIYVTTLSYEKNMLRTLLHQLDYVERIDGKISRFYVPAAYQYSALVAMEILSKRKDGISI